MTVDVPLSDELFDLALACADEAGQYLLSRAGHSAVAGTKTSPTDLVTTDDVAVEQLIRARIGAIRPHDSVFGEELGSSTASSDVRWIIDPIDGTVNFFYGLPTWSISIAAAVLDEVVVGVVDAPVLARRYTAIATKGAWCNGEPLRTSSTTELSNALLATGFSYDADERIAQAGALAAMIGNVRDVRRFGSAAIDLCLLAAGEVDCLYERGMAEYDRAAGLLIAKEAGAIVGVDGSLTWGCAPGLVGPFRAAMAMAGV